MLTAGRQNQGLAKQGRAELTNLGGKRMNSTTLHSLPLSFLRDAGRRNDSRRLWFATLESKEANKGREKLGGDLSKAGAADRESNVEHMQVAASSNERGKTGEDSGLGNREKREKEKETAAGPEEKTGAWADGFRMAGWREQD